MLRMLAVSGLVMMAGAAQAGSSPEAITYLSCRACHAEPATATAIPPIVGLPAEDLSASMARIAANPGDFTIMHRFIKALSPDEIDALASYISGLEGTAP